jgi:hypothetical protein
MSNTDFEQALGETFAEAHLLLLKKHRDYGPTNISRAPGGALNGLRVRIHDKTARINHLYDNEVDPENESLRDSFLDLANYAVIALMVLDGNWPAEANEEAVNG